MPSAEDSENKEADETATETPKTSGITRRSFVYGGGGIVALLALGGVSVAIGDDKSLIRPPGANESSSFLAQCIRCDRCRSACPRDAIGVAKLGSGLMAVRTPTMEFRKGYCDTCDGDYLCIEVCDTGALGAFDPTTDKIGMAVIDEEKCETYLISASCGRVCMDACPANALVEDEEGRVHVDEDACWGCGACEYVCPANAYRAYDGSPMRGVNIEPLERDL
ncbi:MAG: 4Fe-4S dicluster domain-containing protein [Coriobacteriaceae bacterium]|nr:4Fe-4S dicluster domain-containing protein [Coriobacteriaceae bacterium]